MSDTSEPLRILHLASSERWTGMAEPATSLALEQLRAGHTVELACIGGSSFERRVKEWGVPFLQGFHFDRRLNLRHLREDIQRLRRHVAANAIDVIHCHLPHDHWIAAMAMRSPFNALSRQKRPVIIRTMHREAPPRTDLAHRWLVGKGSDLIICVSQSQRQKLIEDVMLPPSRVEWVRGSVDLEKFNPDLPPAHIRDIFEIPHDVPVAGLVARMQPHRGHHRFIDALDEVVHDVPDALFCLIGRGELKRELKERMKQHPLTRHLRRIGYRKDDLPETYAGMDALVLLVPGSDGSCRAMLEAMACGRPVIGCRIGAIADTIQPGENGWLVPPNDRKELALALIDALGNPEKTRQMGQAARAWVEQHHSRPANSESTMKVYQTALDRRAGLRK